MRRCIESSAQNTFATHLPNSLALLGCAWIAWLWANRAWGARAALYAALAVLTSIGPFLYTRFAIPEALLSFLFLLALYCFLTGMESRRPGRFYVDVGGAGAGDADQGADRAGFFCRRGGSSAAA